MRGMTASGLAAVKASPLAEIPAAALRIAAGFATGRVEGLDAVVVKPGTAEGEVLITAAQPCRAVELTVQGTCKRQLGLPVNALRGALRRDPDAEHVVVVDGGDVGLISVRTFSTACTVAVSMPECMDAALNLPSTTPGPCELRFDARLLSKALNDLQPLSEIKVHAFRDGLALYGTAEAFTGIALVAGIKDKENPKPRKE